MCSAYANRGDHSVLFLLATVLATVLDMLAMLATSVTALLC